jgi:hypothetical protein
MRIIEVIMSEPEWTEVPASSVGLRPQLRNMTSDEILFRRLRNAFTPDGRLKWFWDLPPDLQEPVPTGPEEDDQWTPDEPPLLDTPS